tara:strand:+ start:676 stop:879 length:204 start_codon:yes stop_codon:yes gene_type:complete
MNNITNKLTKLINDLPDIKEVIVKQNQDIEDMSQELLGAKMTDNIVDKVVKEEITKEVNKRLKEAFQ